MTVATSDARVAERYGDGFFVHQYVFSGTLAVPSGGDGSTAE